MLSRDAVHRPSSPFGERRHPARLELDCRRLSQALRGPCNSPGNVSRFHKARQRRLASLRRSRARCLHDAHRDTGPRVPHDEVVHRDGRRLASAPPSWLESRDCSPTISGRSSATAPTAVNRRACQILKEDQGLRSRCLQGTRSDPFPQIRHKHFGGRAGLGCVTTWLQNSYR